MPESMRDFFKTFENREREKKNLLIIVCQDLKIFFVNLNFKSASCGGVGTITPKEKV